MTRFSLVTSACAATLLATSPEVSAQQGRVLGPSRCVRCHDAERVWWEAGEGPARGHVRALVRLEDGRATRLLRRLALSDPYSPGAGCVECHATVVDGDAVEGVSCESCHGPGGGYVKVHAQPGAYRAAVAVGMADLVGRVNDWARACLACHVVRDRRLVAAGHPAGATFDFARGVDSVAKHWKNSYANDTIEAAGRAARAELAGPAAKDRR